MSRAIGARFGRSAAARLQGRFVDMLLDVVASADYDEILKISALTTVSVLSRRLPPTPARRALSALLPIAQGADRQRPRRAHRPPQPEAGAQPMTFKAPPDGMRAVALEACVLLAEPASARRALRPELFQEALASGAQEVELIPLRMLERFVDHLPDLDPHAVGVARRCLRPRRC